MIDNGGVVIRLRWKNYNSPAGDNVAMTEWVPLVPPPSAALVLTPASISEAGGVSTVTATLDRTTSAATTITVSAAAGAGAVAADFGLSSATTLTIASGSTTSAGTVTITANDNSAVSGSKQVTVSATAAGDVVEDPSDVTLTITDDEAPQTTLLLSSSSIAENAGVATVTATLDRTSSVATTITVSAAAGAETVAADFGLSSATTLTIAANATTSTGTVTITANDNDTDSPDKQVTVTATVANSQGAGAVSGATLTLEDDDAAPGVTLTVASSSIPEGGSTTVSATLSHPSSAATTVTVTPVADAYSVAPGSGATIVVAAGSTTSADTATITAVDNDVDAAEDKTVTVTGTPANSQGAGTVTGASLTIRDDKKGLAFARAEDPDFDRSRVLEVTEGGAGVAYTVKLTSEPVGEVAVKVAAGNTFLSVSPTELTFRAADWNTARTVTVTARDDGNDDAEPSSVSHRASGGGYDGVSGSLPVSVKGETAVRTDGASGTRTYFIERREVEVTVGDGVPSGIVVDFKGVKAVAAAMTISRDVLAATVERAAGDGFNLGPEGSRTVVDIKVVNAPGVRVCLPVNAAAVAGARDTGRLRLLRDDGSVWAPVAGYEYDAAMARICAPGVTPFGPFATGYVDTTPAFDTGKPALVFTVDEIGSETLPEAAKKGDGGVTYAIEEILPAKLDFAAATRTISGVPTAAQDATDYTLVATDADGDEGRLTFSIEVKPALAEARARLKAINESVLPELSRALWGSTLDAVTGRLESPDAAAPTAAGGLEAAATFARANESALEEVDVSWKELLGAESFAFGLAGDGEGGAGIGGAVAWGSGDWQTRSRYEDLLDWSGGAFSAHAGVDAALRPDLRAGLAASWFSSDVDYTDRSQGEAIAGSHESRMMSLTPLSGLGCGRRDAAVGCGRLRLGQDRDRGRGPARAVRGAESGAESGQPVPGGRRGRVRAGVVARPRDPGGEGICRGDALAGEGQRRRDRRRGGLDAAPAPGGGGEPGPYALDGGATLTPSLELGGPGTAATARRGRAWRAGPACPGRTRRGA